MKEVPARQVGPWEEFRYHTELVPGFGAPPNLPPPIFLVKTHRDTESKLMEKRLRGQERLVKPRSNERSERGPLGSAPDCSRLYAGNCRRFIKTD